MNHTSQLLLAFMVSTLLFSTGRLSAEGTKELSPTPSDSVMLHTNAPGFGNFASFTSFNTISSLNVRIKDFTTDTLYIGLSGDHDDFGQPEGMGVYSFQIRDGLGNIVHGPFLIGFANANASTWSLASNGPDVNGTGGYSTDTGIYPYSVFVPTSNGDYSIEFSDGGQIANIMWFDFTVRNGAPQPGRLWSRNWALRTPPRNPTTPPECQFDRAFNGVFYSYTMDGFVSRIDFDSSGFQGLSFTVAFGDTGPGNSGDVIADRRSVNNANATANNADHMVFVNDPDNMEFPSDTSQCGSVALLSVSCEAADTFCINIGVTEAGQVEVILDFNQNGIYDEDTTDVFLAMIFPSADTACLPWDGLKGDGSPIAFGEEVPTIVRYSQGVQHYAAFDVELLKFGFCVETVRPICPGIATDLLYWDDSQITDDVNTGTIDEGDPGTGQPKVQFNGCECGVGGCRTWTTFQLGDDLDMDCSGTPIGYGEMSTLNTWWYASTIVIDDINLPFAQVSISGDSAICAGDSTMFFANVFPDTASFDFIWSGPGGFSAMTQSSGFVSMAGVYYVTITDPITSCSAIDSVELILFDNPTTMISFTCVGPNQENANVDLTVSGGNPPYTYLWSNGAMTEDLMNVPPGTYSVIVTDANGCMAFDTILVGGCCELIITCPPVDAGTFACADDIPDISMTGIVVVEFCEDVTISSMQSDNAASGCPGDTLLITRVHIVTDDAGNMDTCTQVFTIVDNIPPSLTAPVNDTAIICGDPITPAFLGLPGYTDNCSSATVTFSDDSTGFDGLCSAGIIGSILRTFYAEDDCGNIDSSFIQVIDIIDTIPPTFTAPADITIDCADDISPANTGMVTDTADNCLGVVTLSFSDLVIPGVCPVSDTIIRTWVATDACGNSSDDIQRIALLDTVPPTFTVPVDLTLDCSADIDPAFTGTVDDAIDSCSAVTITFTDMIVENGCPATDTIFRTWIVEDACGNSSTGVQMILRLDTIPPTFTLPADTILDCGVSTDTTITGSVTDITDNCSTFSYSFTDMVVDGMCPGIDTTFRTWIVVDECSNSSTGIQVITRIDTIAPDISCPADITIACTDSSDPMMTGSPTATDACDTLIDFTFSDSVLPPGCTNMTPLIRTWTATDDCGNTSTCTQSIVLEDVVPPTFTTPADVTIACDADASPGVNGAPTDIADNCSTPTVTFTDLIVEGSCSPYTDTILRTWIVTDLCGNSSTDIQSLFRIDTTAPTFTVPPMITIECDQDSLPSITGMVTDTLDNCTAVTVDFSDVILPNGCPTQDTILRTWVVSDLCGNSSSGTQIIIRVDTEAPTFTAPPDTIIDCGVDTSATNLGTVTDAADNCADVTVTYEDVVIEGACPVLFTINRTWTATDECMNASTALQIITVQDTTAPAFTPPPAITIDCDVDIDDLGLTGTVSDVTDCGTIQDTTYMDMVVIDGCDGTAVINRTFSVVDECMNAATAIQTITIQDTLSPNIMIPADVTIECDQNPLDTSITGGMIVFFDNCSMSFMASFTDDNSGLTGCNGTGVILRTWLVDDECDNSATMTQQITIEDSTPPVAVCNDFMIDFGSSSMVVISPDDIDNGSMDNCGDVTLELSQDTFNCDEFIGVSSIPVTLTVTDECGNTSTCIAQVTGIGGVLEITCPDDITVNLGPGECTAIVNYTVTAEAICGGTNVVITQIDTSGLTSGDAFPIGTTIQTYMATNMSDTAICSFTITVIEYDGPVVLGCNDQINVSVDENCEAHIFADMILEGDQYGCYDDFIITVEDFGTDTGWIVISGLPLNNCYTVTITDPDSGNSCWGTVCLEDKLPPLIECPCPVGGGGDTCIISCLEVDQLLDGIIPPGLEPVVVENCGSFTIEIADIILNDEGCGAGTIQVTWLVTDGSGLTASCTQEFGIEPLSIDSLVFPPNYTGECGTSSDPDVTGWPQVNGIDLTDEEGLCNLFLGYWDKVLQDCGGGVKIVRTWTVLDWCTLELVESAQIIKLVDDEGPVLTCPADLTVGTDFWYCYANVSIPRPVASDVCSDVVDFQLDLPTGVIVQFGNNFVAHGLVIGTHVATWIVSDLCGNSSTCSFTITVIDDVAPVANCDLHTIVSLANDGPQGITLVPADVFDDGSYDNCGPVTFRARRMDSCIDIDWTTEGACIDHIPGGIPPVNSRDRGTVHRPCVPFACCDVGAGPVMVELEVTDASGNVNYCMIEVIVQDKLSPFVECPPDIIVSCDFWFPLEEGTFSDAQGNNNGSLDEDPLSSIFGNMFDAFRYHQSVRGDIVINDPGNENFFQPHFWGIDGWADDNCEVNLEVRVRVLNDCSGDDLPANAPPGAVRLIERRFTATDGNPNAPGVCTQRIWVVDFDPFFITDNTCNNPNPNDGVIWPCDVVLTTCPDSVSGTGEPVIFDDACSLIGITYEDTRFDFVEGACFKILRNWKVIDWCQYNPQTGFGLWSYTQVIKVHDEEGPEFQDCPTGPVVLCVEDEGVRLPANNQAFLGEEDPNASSCSVHVRLSHIISEPCSETVKYDVKFYPFNGSDFIQIKSATTATLGPDHTGEIYVDTEESPIQDIRLNGLPYNSPWCGNYHRILWSVQDGCGKWSHCEYLLRLEDCKQPSPVCINGLSTVVMPLGGQVTVWAKDFDASSFDDCTPSEELLFSFSGDVYQPSFTYTCENVPAFGVELSQLIWAADGGVDHNCNGQIEWSERNKDFCTTSIVIIDNADVCDSTGSILAGDIFTNHNDMVASVNVSLKKDNSTVSSMTTIQDGHYRLHVPGEIDLRYQIIPERNDNHKNGVSTLDLVRIQKHLLGIEPFDSPYLYIAADANDNHQVSAIDLVEIRKLILGIYPEFPNNKSWRFIDANATISNESSPWPLEEIINYQHDGNSNPDFDFVAVKVGDVNNTVQANATQILPRNGRRVLPVTLDAALEARAGEKVTIALTIPEALTGFQWTMKSSGMEFAGIHSDDIAINAENVGIISSDVITLSWNNASMKSWNKKAIIYIEYLVTKSGGVAERLEINSDITSAEAYTMDEEILDVVLQSRTISPDEFVLYQNEPNPWTGNTLIRFQLPEAGKVTLSLYDLTGKLIRTWENDYASGMQTMVLNHKDVPANGVLYYRLDSGHYTATKKMIHLHE